MQTNKNFSAKSRLERIETPKDSSATGELCRVEVCGRVQDLTAKLKNISESGAFLEYVRGAYIPKAGDFVRIYVQKPGSDQLQILDAKIVRSQGLCFGAHFVKNFELIEQLFKQLKSNL